MKTQFDWHELEKRAADAVGDYSLSLGMILTKDLYDFLLGMNGLRFTDCFADAEDFILFVQRNHLEKARDWDYSELVQVLVREVSVSQEQAKAFLDCEDAYLQEVGLKDEHDN